MLAAPIHQTVENKNIHRHETLQIDQITAKEKLIEQMLKDWLIVSEMFKNLLYSWKEIFEI